MEQFQLSALPIFAANLGQLLAARLRVDWFEYDRYVDALGFKK